VVNYQDILAALQPEDYTAYFEDAYAYNESLNALSSPLNEYNKLDNYEDVLNVSGNGVMGFVTIPKLGVEIPIYHSIRTEVLNIACGHLEGTSLPIGGESTHSVLSAHRGLPHAKLFTDLDKMELGDTFQITILDQVFTYQVDQIKVVRPNEVEDIQIIDGQDLCTLLTCTPYGINTHRLLVRGHRIENLTGMVVIPAEAVQIPNYVAVPAVAVPMLFIYLLVTLVYYRMRRPDMDHDAALKALREQAGAAAGASKPQDQDVAAEAEAEQASAEVGDDAPIEEPVDDSIEEPAEEVAADNQPENEPGPVSDEPTADDSAEADDNETEPRE
jgi:sortase A